jgi:hypothetical protein
MHSMNLHGKWFTRPTILLVVAVAIACLIAFQYVTAKKMLGDLQLRAAVLDQAPVTPLETKRTLKPGLASIQLSYVTELSYTEVRATFVPILQHDGWHIVGQRHMNRWGSLSDIDEIQLRRDTTCAGLYHSKSLKQAWFIATWVITGCSDM